MEQNKYRAVIQREKTGTVKQCLSFLSLLRSSEIKVSLRENLIVNALKIGGQTIYKGDILFL